MLGKELGWTPQIIDRLPVKLVHAMMMFIGELKQVEMESGI
jgi:hypothetical protein